MSGANAGATSSAASKTALEAALATLRGNGKRVDQFKALHAKLRWRPQLYEVSQKRAWYYLEEQPESDTWIERMKRAQALVKGLRVGICGPAQLLQSEQILLAADMVEAALLPIGVDQQTGLYLHSEEIRDSACDCVYQDKLRLSSLGARAILDRNLERARTEKNKQKKGVLLEVVSALLLSQVNGFEVESRGISNRSQQMDVAVHNRNTSGVLCSGRIVLAEAKNWSSPPGTPEYVNFYRKLETRHGLAKLGFFITTDRFAQTVALEARRDSKGDILVVPLDKDTLPSMWQDAKRDITTMVEKATFEASIGR